MWREQVEENSLGGHKHRGKGQTSGDLAAGEPSRYPETLTGIARKAILSAPHVEIP